MSAEHWREVETLLNEALELEPSRRTAYLAGACGGDESLRREVESLLAFEGQAGTFLETPPDDIAAAAVTEKQSPTMEGWRLGRYELGSLLGAGGMGEVYRARDTRLHRDVAVKILPRQLAENPEALRRFEREARVVAALSHPNILAIHDFGSSRA
jgi:hypothetical protein